MSNESIQPNKSSLVGEAAGFCALPVMTQGFGALTSVARNKGIKGAVESLAVQDFKNMNIQLKNAGKDVFTRSIEISQNYDYFKDITKKAAKLSSVESKTSLPLLERFKNLFRAEKLDLADWQAKVIDKKKLADAADKLADAKSALAKGADIIPDEIAGKAVSKLAGSTGAETAKNLFKSELKNKFVLGITVLGAIPRIKEEVIPAFKEKGFIEGIKTTAKVAVRTGADFISNAGFSAIGRTIGTAIGTVFCPGAGSAFGGVLGDAIGSMFSMKLISKIFDKNKKSNETIAETENLAQTPTEIAYTDNIEVQEPVVNQTETIPSETINNQRNNYPNTRPTQKSAYVKPKNGVYQTQWVNDLNKTQAQADFLA